MIKLYKRNGTIDMMRLVFAIIIVFLHATQYLLSGMEIFIIGSLGVDFFFIVSGFLMVQSSLKYSGKDVGKETRTFLFKKIYGFMPEVIIAWFIAFVVTEFCRDYANIGIIAKDFLQGVWNITFLQMSGLSGKMEINNVTWYLSAMLLAMLFLFPLLLRNRDIFMNIIAPLVTLFILGYLCKVYQSVLGPEKWVGCCYKGFLRGVAELALGCICWNICQSIKKIDFTRVGRYLLTCMELGCYAFTIYWMWGHRASEMDFIIILMMAVAVTISFSGKSCTKDWFPGQNFAYCAKLSLYIYLGHLCWAKNVSKIFSDSTDNELLVIYLILTTFSVLLIHFVSKLLRWVMGNKQNQIKSLFIKNTGGHKNRPERVYVF